MTNLVVIAGYLFAVGITIWIGHNGPNYPVKYHPVLATVGSACFLFSLLGAQMYLISDSSLTASETTTLVLVVYTISLGSASYAFCRDLRENSEAT